jgi:hypothetical protein
MLGRKDSAHKKTLHRNEATRRSHSRLRLRTYAAFARSAQSPNLGVRRLTLANFFEIAGLLS